MWLFFTLATTLIWGLAELFYKKGARPDEKFAHLKICVFVGLVMGAHAVFTLLTQDIGYRAINLVEYLPVSLAYIISMAFSFFGMRFIEESISDPIENTSGALCSLMCVVFLGETISGGSIAAIGIMLVGILGIGFLERTGDTDRTKILGKKMAAVAFAMPFLYALLDAIGSFMDIYFLEMETTPLSGVTEMTIEEVANTSYELTFFLCAIILLIYMYSRGVKFSFQGQKDKMLAAVVAHRDALSIKGIGADDVGSGFEIVTMDVADDVGAADIEQVIVALLRSGKLQRTAKIFLGEAIGLNGRTHGSIEDKNALADEVVNSHCVSKK